MEDEADELEEKGRMLEDEDEFLKLRFESSKCNYSAEAHISYTQLDLLEDLIDENGTHIDLQ